MDMRQVILAIIVVANMVLDQTAMLTFFLLSASSS